MKTSRLTAAMLSCLACTNGVGVSNGTSSGAGIGPEEAQLQSILVPRCRSICHVLSACPNATQACDCASAPSLDGAPSATTSDCTCSSTSPGFDRCFGDCLGDLGGGFLNKGETCAAAGVDVLDCFAGFDCSAFTQSRSGGDACGLEAATHICPTEGDSVSIDGPTTSAPNPTSGGLAGAGGATGITPVANGGSGAAVRLVICSQSSGMGIATANGMSPGPNQQLCDTQYGGCSDGHTYRVFCGTSTADIVNCYCVFDGLAQVSFQEPGLLSQDTSNTACNNVSVMNARCGWSFAVPM